MNLARLTAEARFAAALPFSDSECDITYGQFDLSTDRFHVVGPAVHLTNGNSTGDLIVRKPGYGWRKGDALVGVASIALARISKIEKVIT